MSEPRAQFHLFKRYNRDMKMLRLAIQSDPAVRVEAEAELAAVSGIPRERSVVAAEYADILREALS